MATKIRRVRRIGGIVIGTVRTIFSTGKAWGTARTRVVTARRPVRTVPVGAALAAGVAGGAAGAYFLDSKNGQERRRAVGRRVPALDRAVAVIRRDGSAEEPDEGVDRTTVKMAAGAGAPVPEKESVGAAS